MEAQYYEFQLLLLRDYINYYCSGCLQGVLQVMLEGFKENLTQDAEDSQGRC